MTAAELQVDSVVRDIGTWIDRDNGSPLYSQVAALFRERMESGALKPGTVLPSQRELGLAWGIGEVTIRRALQTLGKDGLIESRPRHGTVVLGNGTTSSWTRESSKALQIGIALADFADGYPFLQPILDGIRDDDCHIAIRLFDIPFREQPKIALADILPLADLHGLVMMSPANLRVVSICQSRRLPVVLMFSDLADGFSHCIAPNYASGMIETVNHLTQKGRNQIALVTAGADRFSTGRWIEGFEIALQTNQRQAQSEYIVSAGYSEYDGFRATRQLLALDTPPDAIIYASDFMARGGLLAAEEANISVPDKLSIVGAGRVINPNDPASQLPSIDLGLKEMGRRARQAIQAKIEGENDPPLRQTVATHYHTAPAKTEIAAGT